MKLNGNHISMRLVEITDAEFIINLRTKENKSQFLSKINNNVQEQIEWLLKYKKKEKEKLEYYFMIENSLNERIGLYRLSNIQQEYATPGSWVMSDGAKIEEVLESVLLMYDFVFYILKKKFIDFDVRKKNLKVVNFHKKYGAKITKEDSLNYFFHFSIDDYTMMKKKYERYL